MFVTELNYVIMVMCNKVSDFMKEHINKLLTFLILFVSFFIGTKGVDAACSCYFIGQLMTDDNSYRTDYLLEVSLEAGQDPKIAYFGESGFDVNSGKSGAYNDLTDDIVSNNKFLYNFDDEKKELADNVANNSCSVTAASAGCNRFTIYYESWDTPTGHRDRRILWSQPTIDVPILGEQVTWDPTAVHSDRFTAISKDNYTKLKKSNNVAGTMKDEGLGDSNYTTEIEAIKKWAATTGQTSVTDIGDPCNIIDGELQNLLSLIFWILSILGIILVVVMTALSFIKAIVGSDDEKFRDAFRHLVIRIVVVIILLLLPMILDFIIGLINDNIAGVVKIGSDGNPFCDIA